MLLKLMFYFFHTFFVKIIICFVNFLEKPLNSLAIHSFNDSNLLKYVFTKISLQN